MILRTNKASFFSLFFLLICTLFLLTGCQKAETTKEHPVVKGDTMVIAISEEQEDFYRLAISSYCKKYPDIKVSIVTIPNIDNQDTPENEENINKMDQMRVEIMAGKGPDVFLLNKDNPLFPDVIKNSYNGTFYDMNDLLKDTLKSGELLDMIMEAGVIEDKRYLIPLGFTISGMLTTETWLNGWEPTATQPAPFFEEILTHNGGTIYSLGTLFDLSSFTKEGLLNYEKETSVISEELMDVLKLAQKQERADYLEETPPIYFTKLGAQGTNTITSLLANNEIPVFLPIPNGSGTTAQIATFGAVRANSGYTLEAKDLFTLLLSADFQGANKWASLQATLSPPYVLPVNQATIAEDLRYKLKEIDPLQQYGENFLTQLEATLTTLLDAIALIDAVRFTTYEDQLLYEYVIKTMWSRDLSLEEGLELMEEEQRFYFSE